MLKEKNEKLLNELRLLYVCMNRYFKAERESDKAQMRLQLETAKMSVESINNEIEGCNIIPFKK